jgi:flagellar hook-length control protein FliK
VSLLPLSPNNALLKESAPARETAMLTREAGVFSRDSKIASEGPGRTADSGAIRETGETSETASTFRKIFQEKKTEREQPTNVRQTAETSAGKETPVVNVPVARERLRKMIAPAEKTAAAKADAKPATLKNILSALLENRGSVDKAGRVKKSTEKNDDKHVAEHGERLVSLRERLEQSRRKDNDTASVQALFSKPGREKNEKTAVIIDLRSPDGEKTKSSPAAGKPVVKNAEKDAVRDMKKPEAAKEQVEIRYYAKQPSAPDGADGVRRTGGDDALRARTDFSARLADAVKNEMVKHSGIVLKDGGAGEIHLVLKPESLGSVRIKLNLDDKHIAGEIIVDNNTVKKMVEDNLGNLETALRDKGYESAALNVFVAGERNESQTGERDFGSLLEAGRPGEIAALDGYAAGGGTIYDDALVNIVL